MNKHLYRVVFNQKTGVMVAVAETAKAHGSALASPEPALTLATRTRSSISTFGVHACFTRLAIGIALLCGGISNVCAQITAAPNAAGANRPVIDNTANGRPLIQIVAPNAAGVSHNQYQQFNVDRNGAILNNATGNALTQQGGWVAANPNIGNGAPARLILNEVTSTNPSQLRGYLEVAGQRADVVVSNPNGIMVDGFGFINASRGVLTTGVPVLGSNGSLDALRVTQGNIAITGAGLNDQATAQLDLIARSVQVNAGIWADRLNVVTGANQINYADLGVQIIQGSGNAPTVAIDVASIGGMYANRIKLVGTEAGVGVTSYGKMAAAGDFSLDSAGKITLGADTSASGKLHIASDAAVVNQATLSSGGDMEVRAATVIDNHGSTLLAGGNLILNATTLNNTGGGIKSNRNARLGLQSAFTNAQGDALSAVGDLSVTTTGDFVNDNALTAGGNLSVQATNITNSKDGLLSAGQSTLLQADQSVVNTGRIYGQDIAIGAQSLRNDHEGVYGDNIAAGVIAARNTFNVGVQTLVNREHALLKSDGDMAIGGALDASNKATGIAASIINSSATIDSGGKLAIRSASLVNTNAHFASEIQLDPRKTRQWTAYLVDGNPRVYSSEEAFVDERDADKKLIIISGERAEDYTIRTTNETTSRTVVTHTDPGKILARSDMSFAGGTVTNDKSAIVAGGALSGQIDGADNGGTNPQGEIIVRRTGTSVHHTVESCGPFGRAHCNAYSSSTFDMTLPTEHADLGIWTALAHTPPDSTANPSSDPGIATMPASLLFRPVSTPGASILIETDPAFLNLRQFLSSDYLLGRMGMNPQTAQKRLGDGYYEQQLINDQILQLTGRKFLGATASNEDQYKALMDAGVAFAQTFSLTPGMALSAAQMAQLTADIVWLVEQRLTLPDGSVQNVLAPVVYLSRLRAQDLKPTGALIAADNINLQINGSLNNAGTLQANTNLIIHAANDINNTLGTISSNASTGNTTLIAGRDLNHQSGTINGNRVGILTGRDANVITATTTTTGINGTQIGLDKIATINAGQLTVQSGRDANFNAAQVSTTGDTIITANRDINVGAVTTQEQLNVSYDDKNHLYTLQTHANGSVVQTGGNTSVVAGRDITTQAAYINSAQTLTAMAGNNLHLGASAQGSRYDQEIYTASSGPLASRSIHSKDLQTNTQAVGSTLSGNTITAQAGHDLNITGSNIVGTNQVSLAANNNIDITSTQDIDQRSLHVVETKSGAFTGGNRLHIGKKITDTEQTSTGVTNNAGTIGSVNGSVAINAGNDVNADGLQLQAKQNIDVSGRNVNIAATVDTFDSQTITTVTTSGLRIGAKSNITDAAMALRQATNRGQEVNDPRLKALYAAKAAYAATDLAALAKSVQQSQGGGASGKVSIGIGTTIERHTSTTHVDTVNKAQARAGGQLNITAKGDATPDQGDINLTGAALQGDSITLDAKRDLNTRSQAATSKSEDKYQKLDLEVGLYAGGSIGGSGGAKGGLGIYGSAEYQQSKTELSSTTHEETTLDATNKLSLKTGRDASLTGTVATADTIKADIGRNLSLKSEQDIDRYRQQQLGGQIEGRYAFGNDSGASGSLNYSQTKSDYKSVQEQTGLNAGKGGFDITVGKRTQLDGATIASTATPDKNTLSTDTFGHSDLKNEASYSALSANISFGGGGNGGGSGGSSGLGSPIPTTILPGLGAPTSDKKDSTTRSAIAAGTITIKQDQQTGTDSTNNLSRDTANANQKLERIFDANKVAEQQEMGRVLGEVGNRAIGDLSQKLNLKDGSPEKMALHAALGALQAGAAGGNALAGAAAAGGMEWLNTQVADYLVKQPSLQPTGNKDEDIKRESQRKVIQQWAALIGGATIGGAIGGNGTAGLAGGATALDAERYNRQLHPKEIVWIETNKKAVAEALSEKLSRHISEAEAMRYLTMAGEGNTDKNNQTANSNQLGLQTSEERQAYNAAKQYLAENAKGIFVDDRGVQQQLFVAKGKDFNDATVYSQYRNDKTYRDFYWNTMGDNLKPDNPSKQEQATYNQRETIRLANAAKQLATGLIPAAMAGATGAVIKNGAKAPIKEDTTTSTTLKQETDALKQIGNNLNGPDLNNKAPNTVLNLQYLKELEQGKLPGVPVGAPGTPREMASSVNPSAMAEDFAMRFFGGKLPADDQYIQKGLPNVGGKPCPDCWVARAADGTAVTYRPAGFASDGTLPTTASVDLNSERLNNLNRNDKGRSREVKLKFPETGKTGVAK